MLAAVAACSSGGGDDPPPSTVASTVASTAPGPPVVGIDEAELSAYVADGLAFADDIVDVVFLRGGPAVPSAVELVLADATASRAGVVCEELATFLASHPTFSGVATIVVYDDRVGDRVLVRNDDIRAGVAGTCEVV